MNLKKWIATGLIVNFILLPLAQAQQENRAAIQVAQGQIQSLVSGLGELENKLGKVIQREGLTVVTSQNQPTTVERVFTEQQDGFALVTPANGRGIRLAIQIRRSNLDLSKLKMTLVARQYAEDKAIDTFPQIAGTTLTILPGDDARAVNLKVERASQFLGQSISTYFSLNRKADQNILSKAIDLLLPKAEAANTSEILRKLSRLAFLLAAGATVKMVLIYPVALLSEMESGGPLVTTLKWTMITTFSLLTVSVLLKVSSKIVAGFEDGSSPILWKNL